MPIPEDRRYAIPMLAVSDGKGAIAFYEKAFGAIFDVKMEENGKIGHAEFHIGDACVMLADEWPGHNASPRQLGGTSMFVFLYVEDVDALADRAVAEGAKLLRPLSSQGQDRIAKLRDPFGHVWMFATRVG